MSNFQARMRALRSYAPSTCATIAACSNSKFSVYIDSLFKAAIHVPTLATQHFSNGLLKDGRLRLSNLDVINLVDELRNGSPIQGGPHLMPLTNRLVHEALALNASGNRKRSRKYVVWSAFSCDNLYGSGIDGPSWLHTPDGVVKLFNASSRTLKKHSLCSNIKLEISDDANEYLRKTRINSSFEVGDMECPLRTLTKVNEALWEKSEIFSSSKLVLIDDLTRGHIVSEHLRDPTSLITQLVTDESYRELFTAKWKDVESRTTGGIYKTNKNLFYAPSAAKPEKLNFSSNALIDGNGKLHVENDVEDIVNALSENRLIPGILLSVLATAFLPGFRVIGGPFHIIYNDIIIQVLKELSIENSTGLQALIATGVPHGWGMCVLRPNILKSQDDLMSHSRLAEVERSCFRTVTEDLAFLDRHPVWSAAQTNCD